MLLDYFKHKELLDVASIEETINSLRIKISPCEPISSFIPKLFDELKTVSARDHFELFFDILGNHVKVTDCSSCSYKLIEEHINEYKDDDTYEIELTIKKNLVDHTLSIYFLDDFADYLAHESSINIIRSISSNFDSFLYFEVFSIVAPFGSNTILFTEVNNTQQNIVITSTMEREDKLDLLFDNSSVTNLSLDLIPSDFYMLAKSTNENINLFFKRICSELSLIFLSNSSEFKSDGKLSYKITGYKTIANEGVALDELLNIHKLLFKIYSWAFEGGNSSDKIGLIRNVLSIHLDEAGRIKFDTEVWEAIQSNYQIYLKGNIQSYLEIKNKLSEFIIESTTKTYSMADELLDSLKNNIAIFLTFLLTVVVVNGLKDNGELSIFSNTYLAIVLILCLLSLLWLWMTNCEIINRYDSATKTVKQILNLNYNKLLMDTEIDECIDPIIKKNRTYLHAQLSRYSRWWLTLIIVFALSYISANRFFAHDNEYNCDRVKQVATDKNNSDKIKNPRPNVLNVKK